MKQSYKIAFVNQSTGLLFKGLAKNLSMEWFPAVLYTGCDSSPQNNSLNEHLVERVFNAYDRTSVFSRILSGLIFSLKVFYNLLKNRHRLVIFVSNPPFIPFVGLLLKKVINQKYIIIVYDIYPDILLEVKNFSEKNFIVKLWRKINKLIYEQSEAVITIGVQMKKALEMSFDSNKTSIGEVVVIPNCADPLEINYTKNISFVCDRFTVSSLFVTICD